MSTTKSSSIKRSRVSSGAQSDLQSLVEDLQKKVQLLADENAMLKAEVSDLKKQACISESFYKFPLNNRKELEKFSVDELRNIDKNVHNMVTEIKQRIDKTQNLIIYNLPESENDTDKVKLIVSDIEPEVGKNILKIVRVGTINPSDPRKKRPIKIITSAPIKKSLFLNKQEILKKHNVRISRDKTILQQVISNADYLIRKNNININKNFRKPNLDEAVVFESGSPTKN